MPQIRKHMLNLLPSMFQSGNIEPMPLTIETSHTFH